MKEFTMLLVDETDYECLLVEIAFNGQRLCQVSREEGPDKLRIEFLKDLYVLPDEVRMEFALDDFLAVIQESAEILRSRPLADQ